MSSSPAEPGPKAKSPSLFGVFFTVFLDMLGFGIFIPDLQLRGQKFAAAMLGVPENSNSAALGFALGAVLGVFSLVQLLCSSSIGHASDAIGRKKVLLFTAIINLVSYVVYGYAGNYAVLFFARALAGVGAGNLGVAFAYVADITTPENRSKGLGLVGAAFGLGFILGPATGAWLLRLGNDDPLFLGYAGAALILVNILYIQFGLVESRPKRDPNAVQPSLADNFRTATSVPELRILLAMFFIIGLGFTNLETTYFQLLSDPRGIYRLGADAKNVGAIILTIVGVVAVIMQAGLLPMLTRRFGEVNLARTGLFLLGPALALVPFAPLWGWTVLGVVLLGVANGMAQPSVNSLISRAAPREMQGGIFGITNSLGSFARFVGPLVSGPLFRVHPAAPYILGGALMVLPAIAAWKIRQPDPSPEGDAVVAG